MPEAASETLGTSSAGLDMLERWEHERGFSAALLREYLKWLHSKYFSSYK
jgi:hypothetical protein